MDSYKEVLDSYKEDISSFLKEKVELGIFSKERMKEVLKILDPTMKVLYGYNKDLDINKEDISAFLKKKAELGTLSKETMEDFLQDLNSVIETCRQNCKLIQDYKYLVFMPENKEVVQEKVEEDTFRYSDVFGGENEVPKEDPEESWYAGWQWSSKEDRIFSETIEKIIKSAVKILTDFEERHEALSDFVRYYP